MEYYNKNCDWCGDKVKIYKDDFDKYIKRDFIPIPTCKECMMKKLGTGKAGCKGREALIIGKRYDN